MAKKEALKPIPEVGKFYHFFDDGKTGPNRHYICKVERIISIDEAKIILFDSSDDNSKATRKISLFEIWENEVKKCHWLYSSQTDVFVEISCPTYDENNLYAARTKTGGWFTMDIQSDWQSGMVDSDSSIFNGIIKNYKNSKWPEMVDNYPEATEENYKKRYYD